MKLPKRQQCNHQGFTLVEALVDAAILSMLSVVIIASLLGSLRSGTKAAKISAAGQLANEKMETIRNLPYDSLATQHGPIYPQGTILDDETVTRDSKTFLIHTDIKYVDDPFDGLGGGNPNDLNPADYKKVTIAVSDPTSGSDALVTLSTDIASRAAETASNTGVLKITVLDASGQGLDGAGLTITNSSLNPAILINSDTDSSGNLFIPNLPIGTGYHITASKSGYNNDGTTPASGSNPHPTNPDATILLQQVSAVTLNVDLQSVINFNTIGTGGSSLNLAFTGQKLIGSNPNVYKNSFSRSTASSITISAVEYDSYTVSPPSGWYTTTCTLMQPFVVNPADSVDQTCTFTTDPTAIQIQTISPTTTPAVNDVAVIITGLNLANASVSIQSGSNPEVSLSGLSSSDNQTMSGNVDLSQVPTGTYNLIIRDGNGHQTTQVNGLVVQ